MDKHEKPSAAFFLDEDADPALRAETEGLSKNNPELQSQVVTQAMAHGLVIAEHDKSTGATKARTDAALAKLPQGKVVPLSPAKWIAAAAIVIAMGVFSILYFTQDDQSQGDDPQANASDSESRKDPEIDPIRVIDGQLNLHRTADRTRLQNDSGMPAVVHLKNGGVLTLDAKASLVLVDAGSSIQGLSGRVGLEGRGMKVALSERDLMMFGNPAVAVYDQGYFGVYSGKISDLGGVDIIRQGERLDLATMQAEPFDAGELPSFIAAGRVDEVFNAFQSKSGSEVELSASRWKPILRAMLAEPVGRELAKESVETLVSSEMTDQEFAAMMMAMEIGIEYQFEVFGEEKAIQGTKKMIENWRKATPDERAERQKRFKKMLKFWRDLPEEKREQYRRTMKAGFGSRSD